jgi:hypothetical protein
MNTFSFKKENFYKNDTQEPFHESFLVNASDEITLDDTTQMLSGVYFKLDIYKKNKDLMVEIELLSWSNSEQKHLPISHSIWSEEGFGSGKHIPTFQAHYKKIISNFFAALKNLKYHWQIKDLIFKIKHPSFIFHYKLLNLFSQQELESIMLMYFSNHPLFNIPLFQKPPKRNTLDYAFLPQVVNGFYLEGIEVSVDLNESDMPLLEDLENGIISKEEFLKRIALL